MKNARRRGRAEGGYTLVETLVYLGLVSVMTGLVGAGNLLAERLGRADALRLERLETWDRVLGLVARTLERTGTARSLTHGEGRFTWEKGEVSLAGALVARDVESFAIEELPAPSGARVVVTVLFRGAGGEAPRTFRKTLAMPVATGGGSTDGR